MRTQNSMALPARTLQRNRRLLLAAAVLAVPALGFASTILVGGRPVIRPLLAIDESPISELVASNDLIIQASPSDLNPEILQSMHEWVAGQDVAGPSDAALDGINDNVVEVQADSEVRWFNGRPLKPAHTMMMTVTAYSPDARSCGDSADGITASGYSVFTNGMKLVAADTKLLPFGSLISVPGYDNGHIVPVLDRGGAIKGNRLDVLFPTHEQAREFGVKKLQVTVWDFADGEPSDYVPIYKAADSVVTRSSTRNAG